MSRIGRPSRLVAEQRRRSVARLIARWAHENAETVKRLSEELHVGERAVRADLERLAAERTDVLQVPPDLAAEIARANTAEELLKIERRLVADAGRGQISLEAADFFLNACRELRQTIKKARGGATSDGDWIAAGLARMADND